MGKLMRYLAVFITLSLSGRVLADTPSNGLGQSWPNAPDQSASPRFHVYVFTKDGVRFIQVNDAVGQVKGALATAGGQMLALPMGSGSQLVTKAAPTAASTPLPTDETVYRDDDITITARQQTNGVVLLQAVAAECTDPVRCNSQVSSPH